MKNTFLFSKYKRTIHSYSIITLLLSIFFCTGLTKAMTISDEEQLIEMINEIKSSHRCALEKHFSSKNYSNEEQETIMDMHNIKVELSEWEKCHQCSQMLLKAIKKTTHAQIIEEFDQVKVEMQVLNDINSIDANNRNDFIRRLSSENIKLKAEMNLNKDEPSICCCSQILRAAVKRFLYGK